MKLGEQWIEMIDGQEHMVKVVKGPCERCCVSHLCNLSSDCPMDWGLIAIDLGILKDGRLPCPFCGEYPSIKYDLGEYGFYLVELSCCHYHHGLACRRSDIEEFTTQIIDAWNRRA